MPSNFYLPTIKLTSFFDPAAINFPPFHIVMLVQMRLLPGMILRARLRPGKLIGLKKIQTTLDNLPLTLKRVKIGCTLAMLVCLSRSLRIAYILGDIF